MLFSLQIMLPGESFAGSILPSGLISLGGNSGNSTGAGGGGSVGSGARRGHAGGYTLLVMSYEIVSGFLFLVWVY